MAPDSWKKTNLRHSLCYLRTFHSPKNAKILRKNYENRKKKEVPPTPVFVFFLPDPCRRHAAGAKCQKRIASDISDIKDLQWFKRTHVGCRRQAFRTFIFFRSPCSQQGETNPASREAIVEGGGGKGWYPCRGPVGGVRGPDMVGLFLPWH